jgi:multidrug efflux pump subunit AcrA (membrane-fusion protein)
MAVAVALAFGVRRAEPHGGDDHDHGGGRGGLRGVDDLDAPRKLSPEARAAVGLVVAEAAVRPMEETLTLPAVLRRKPDLHARVSARYPGRVAEVRVNLGDAVAGPSADGAKPGDVIAAIESPELARLQTDLARAAAEAEALRSALRSASAFSGSLVLNQLVDWQAQYLAARGELERARALAAGIRRGGEGVPRLEVLKAEQDEARAAGHLEGLRARFAALGFGADLFDRLGTTGTDGKAAPMAAILATAPADIRARAESLGKPEAVLDRSQALALKEAEIARLRRELSIAGFPADAVDGFAAGKGIPAPLPVRSPISGRVAVRSAVVGQYAAADTVLLEIADYSRLWAEAEVPEGLLARVMDRKSQRVRLRTAARPDVEHHARVVRLSGELGERERTAHLIAEVDNPSGELLANMFAKATVVLKELPAALSVPRDAVLTVGAETFVFVENGDQFEKRDIVPGARDDRFVEVRKGKLFPGDRVVTQGAYQLIAARPDKHDHGHDHKH